MSKICAIALTTTLSSLAALADIKRSTDDTDFKLFLSYGVILCLTQKAQTTQKHTRVACMYLRMRTLGVTDSCERSNAAKSVKSVKSVGA